MTDPAVATIPDYLSGLNDDQREAATYGITTDQPAGPLLVIAGAGSGKTNTLAHRVAHLLASGADPDRLLLLTFSRRAADEMTRRVQRIASQVSPRHARLVSGGFPWSGTFHSVGARLLREYAPRIGLSPGFTIHDREDSADLMNIVRNEQNLSAKGKRFPLKGTCLSIYSAVVNTQGLLAEILQSVSILNVVDGCLPLDMATGSEEEIEEERRLLYVAMTRAKDHLELMLPQRFYTNNSGTGDRHVYANRTRFIPNRLVAQFEQRTWPQVTLEQAGVNEGQGRIDLAARMRGMWK